MSMMMMIDDDDDDDDDDPHSDVDESKLVARLSSRTKPSSQSQVQGLSIGS